jgi:hypothetical protein
MDKMDKTEKLRKEYKELQIVIKHQEKYLRTLHKRAHKKWSKVYELNRDKNTKSGK